MKQMEVIQNPDTIRNLCKKMAPPLVTLLSAEPEIQYVALRNINLIVQSGALEFKEYATEVDVDFVRKAVRAIGRCAVSLERAAERCINVLLELIQTKVNYVVQEAIIVIKDIFRRYPNQYESIIGTLCENLDTLDEPEAKASMIWIIGEYAERIDNADELLETFLETFPEEVSSVQLQLLTATVKLFLKKPTEGPQQMIQLVLSNATQETDNPDLRDRAYIYWRLLSTDPEAAKAVVLADKPVIDDSSHDIDPALLQELLNNLGTLSSVFHKPPESFVSRTHVAVAKGDDLEKYKFEDEDSGAVDRSGETSATVPQMDDILGSFGGPPLPPAATTAAAPSPAGGDLLGDLLSLDDPAPAPAPPAAMDAFEMMGDLMGGFPAAAAPSLPEIADAARGKGLRVCGEVSRQAGAPVYRLALTNSTAAPITGLMIQFNKNSFGLAPARQDLTVGPIPPGATATTDHPLAVNPAQVAPGPLKPLLQVALKSNETGVLYLNDQVSVDVALVEDGIIDSNTFLTSWRSLPDSPEGARTLQVTISSVEAATEALKAKNIHLMAHRQVAQTGQEAMYMAGKAFGVPVLLELKFALLQPAVTCTFKSERMDLAPPILQLLQAVLQ
eukprot:CAMPEP_0117676238 /NCGR_PEP_ID=MMETSP0804-20121206/16049_1 /TAXON_ID=1074897 /ORGANISM="Tetraselmis astigmatica, Strain CCMP880" /LENGTH=615 /DNA_ID=CAMNT_0005485329 /DNA_START=20 /DNA_END=1868 /DNA_ORIENTATION=+